MRNYCLRVLMMICAMMRAIWSDSVDESFQLTFLNDNLHLLREDGHEKNKIVRMEFRKF